MVMSSEPTREENADQAADRFSPDLVSRLYNATPSSVFVHVVNALILMAVLRDFVSDAELLVWGGVLAAAVVLRGGLFLVFTRLFAKAMPSADKAQGWSHAMMTMTFVTGLTWGSAAWVFMPPQSVEHQLFTAVIMLVVTVSAIGNLYPVLAAYQLFVVPVIVMFMVRLMMMGTTIHFAMAASAFVLLVVSMFFAKRRHGELVQSLELRFENAALMERLSQENKDVKSEYGATHRMETLLRQKSAVLDTVSKIQGLFIADRNPNAIFTETLDTILNLTSSSSGFIGEVLLSDDGQRYLRTFAVSDAAWDHQARKDLKDKFPDGIELRNHQTLCGKVVQTGEPIIVNQVDEDAQFCLSEHVSLPISAFLGLPLYLGEDLVGVVGMANREGGYDIELITALEPVITTTARMIEAVQSRHARHDAQAAREVAMQQAEKANRAKTEFLSAMSHELRTPMNAVLGFAQLLQLNPQVPLHPKQADSVEQILKAGNHLLDLINEILDLSRIEAGRVNLTLEDIDPCEVIEDCISYITPMAQRRGLTLDAQIPPAGQITITTDRIRFRQVLLNLLSNAVKYNADDGTVTLNVHGGEVGGEGVVRFNVADTGPGISQDKRIEIFEPFSRLGAEATEIEGTGIGLTISRKLTELMGGTLDFESVIGRGSTFWIELPGVTKTAKPTSQPDEGVPLPSLPSGQHTVLYVEDNPDNLMLMDHVVTMVGNVDLITAHTGELGVEMAEIHHPEVILMDINLPGISGIEALKRLRDNAETKAIPVIAISADAMADDIQRGLDEGFDAYLTKPIDLGQVIDHIALAVEGKLSHPAKARDEI